MATLPRMPEQQSNKKADRKRSKRENDAYALEMMAVREREKRRARIRRRIVTAVVVVVVVVAAGTGGWYWWYRADLATYAGPKNMLSDGVLLTGSNSAISAVTTKALAPKATPTPTDLSSRTATANIAFYFDLSDRDSADFLATTGGNLGSWLEAGYITLELHPLAVHDTAKNGHWSLRSANAIACVAATTPKASFAVAGTLAEKSAAKGFDGLSDAKLIAAVQKAGATSDAIASCIRAQSFDHWVELATARAEHKPIPNSKLKKLGSTPLVLVDKEKYTGKLTSAKDLVTFITEVEATKSTSSSKG